MKDKIKSPGLSNPETYVLTHNGINNYMVLIFTDLKKAQIYKMPYRNSPHQEIEILMRFIYLHVFKSNELSEDYHIRKPNDGNFLFKSEDKKNIFMWGKNYLVLKQMMKLYNILQNMVLTMLNPQLLTVKKTFTSCYTKNI